MVDLLTLDGDVIAAQQKAIQLAADDPRKAPELERVLAIMTENAEESKMASERQEVEEADQLTRLATAEKTLKQISKMKGAELEIKKLERTVALLRERAAVAHSEADKFRRIAKARRGELDVFRAERFRDGKTNDEIIKEARDLASAMRSFA